MGVETLVDTTLPLSNGGDDGEYTDDDSLQGPEGAGDNAFASLVEEEGANNENNEVGTKSMADEIDNFGSGSEDEAFGNTNEDAAFGSNNEDEAFGSNNEDEAFGNTDTYVGNNEDKDGNYQGQDDNFDDNGDAAGSEVDNDDATARVYGQEGGSLNNNNWDLEKEEPNNWDDDGADALEEQNNFGNNDESGNSWNGDNTDTAANLGGSGGYDYQGGENSFNNNVPSGQEGDPFNNNVPSANSLNNNAAAPSTNANTYDGNNSWDYDDDDGFPTGLFIALLALFIFFIYRKSTQSQQQEQRNCTTRGGYQPVRPGDHNKRY